MLKNVTQNNYFIYFQNALMSSKMKTVKVNMSCNKREISSQYVKYFTRIIYSCLVFSNRKTYMSNMQTFGQKVHSSYECIWRYCTNAFYFLILLYIRIVSYIFSKVIIKVCNTESSFYEHLYLSREE